MVREFVKISVQDLEIAEAFFENEKHFNEWLLNVFRYYLGKNVQIKTKIVQKYFNSYKKTMDYLLEQSDFGAKGAKKKAEIQRLKELTLQGGLEASLEETLEAKDKDKDNIKEKDIISDFSESQSPPIENPTTPKDEEEKKEKKKLRQKEKKDYSQTYLNFLSWATQNTPTVMKMKKPLTEEELNKLLSVYDKEKMKIKLIAMENNPNLLKKYSSTYLTVSNWLDKDFDSAKPLIPTSPTKTNSYVHKSVDY